MNETVETLNILLATGGILVLLASSVLLVDLYTSRVFEKIISIWGLLIALSITVASVVMTLLYSEVFGFIPCGLCWFQRIFLYPQVFILVIALWYKDKKAARYGMALSVPGLVVALYQHYLQMGGNQFVSCPTSGVDCTKRIMFEYGFVTFPLLSAFLFVFLIALYWYILKSEKSALKF